MNASADVGGSELVRRGGPRNVTPPVRVLRTAAQAGPRPGERRIGAVSRLVAKLGGIGQMGTSLLASRQTHRAAALLSTAVCALWLQGCGTSYPPAPKLASVSEQTYVIGPLDNLAITVWRNPELSTQTQVRPDGRISTPLVQDLEAMGRTPAELAQDIEKALTKYIRDPVVTVVVSGFQGTYSQQIRVIGEAAHPQSVPYRQSMTLLDVMIVVGGLTDFADGNAAVLVRGSEQGKQYSVRLKDLIKRGDISANVEMRPGDVLIIPQSWF
jgi:polysaccharide biosynthesis/export protein